MVKKTSNQTVKKNINHLFHEKNKNSEAKPTIP